jgi:hypothetical protein
VWVFFISPSKKVRYGPHEREQICLGVLLDLAPLLSLALELGTESPSRSFGLVVIKFSHVINELQVVLEISRDISRSLSRNASALFKRQ